MGSLEPSSGLAWARAYLKKKKSEFKGLLPLSLGEEFPAFPEDFLAFFSLMKDGYASYVFLCNTPYHALHGPARVIARAVSGLPPNG